MKRILLCSVMLWAGVSAMAQQTVKGKVRDVQIGNEVPFVSIYNQNNQQFTETDLNGNFEIKAAEDNDSLVISLTGYESQTILASKMNEVQLKTSLHTLNEVIISSNREAERRIEAPIAIATINEKTIQQNKPTSIDQVLNQTPGVNMVDLGNEQHTMSIRRPIDYGASYLYLENGVPVRASGVFNHNALLEINMAAVNRIEIVRGPASSIYGSEAIGGAVNFITKAPTKNLTAGLSLQGNNIGYKRTDFYASNTFNDKLGVRVSGYYANQKDGLISHSDFDKLALSFAATYKVSDKGDITWNNTLIDYEADMSGSLDSADFYSKTYTSNQTFTYRKVNAYRTSLAYYHRWNKNAKTSFTGYYRNNSIKQNPSYRVKDDFKPWVPSGNPNLAHGQVNDNSFNSYGFIGQHQQKFKFLNASLISGISVDVTPNTYEAKYISIFKSDAGIYESFSETDSLLADYKADLTNLAAYSQLKLELIKGMFFTAGLRYDQFLYAFDNQLGSNAYTAVTDGSNKFNQLTPKLGLTYNFNNNKGVYVNYSRGFVPPQVSELYVGNEIPLLDPVYYVNYELGGWASFLNGKGKLEASIYRMEGTNEVISVMQEDGSRIKQNAGKTLHQGIEYGLSLYPCKDVSFRFSGTNAMHEFVDFVESGNDFSGKQMPQAPKFIANSQITYMPSFVNGFRTSVEWQYVDGYYMDQANTKKYDGYSIFNVRLGYEFKAFELWTNIMNVTDELYATVARSTRWGQSYSVGKARNFNVGVAYNFKAKSKK